MANLQGNTTYNTSGTQSPIANLSSLIKQIQQKNQSASSDIVKKSLDTHFDPRSYDALFGTNKKSVPSATQVETGIPLGQPIAPQQVENYQSGVFEPTIRNTATKTQPLPEGYNQFAPTDANGNWVNPSDQTNLRNWPLDMGGGQYAVDPTQPGKMVKSTRAIMDYKINPGAKQKVLGKLSPQDYQVDHIVPLWIGGADTLGNLQIFDNITHAQKTAVQSVPLTLLANGKIDLNQAKVMALTWKDKEAKGIPIPDDKGYIPVDVAEKIAKKWQEGPSMWSYFGEAFKENMSNLGNQIPVVGEFAKGLVGGGTAGIVPGTAPTKESGIVGGISNFAGNLVGMLTGIGLMGKGIGLGIKGAKSLLGIKKAVNVADSALKTAGLITDVGNVAKVGKWTTVGTSIKNNALLLTAWGQLGLTGREMTGQEEFDFSNHVKQAAVDTIYGTLLGSAGVYGKGGQTIKGYAHVGLGTTAWSLIQGADIQDAVKEGIIMTGLHGMGYKNRKMDPRNRMASDEAYKMSATTINQYSDGLFPTIKLKEAVPQQLTFDAPTLQKYDNARVEYQKKYPLDNRFKDLGPITNEWEALNFLEQVSRKNVLDFKKEVKSEEQIQKELQRVAVSINQLGNQMLPTAERQMKEWKDLVTLGEKLRPQIKKEQVRPAMNATEVLDKLPINVVDKNNISVDIQEKYKNELLPEGYSTTRGIGRDEKGVALDPEARTNLNDFAVGKRKSDGKIYFPVNEKSQKIGTLINNEAISSGTPPPISNPENTLRGFMKDTNTGEFLPIGYFTQPKGISEKNPLSTNKPYIDMVNRFKSTWLNSPDANSLMEIINKDKAFKDSPITIEKAQELFAMKNQVPAMTNEDILRNLQPSNSLVKYTIDNSMVTPRMKELDIPVLIVDVTKISPIGAGENIKDPSIEFNVTRNDYLRSLATKDVNPTTPITPEKTPVSPQPADFQPDFVKRKMAELGTPISLEETTRKADLAPKMPQNAIKVSEVAQPSSQIVSKAISSKMSTKDPIDVSTNEFFGDMVDKIENLKIKPTNPSSHEKILMDVVKGFKRKNPGLKEEDFKTAMSTAKGRATIFVQDFIDSTYKGTKYFGTDDTYARTKKSESDNVLIKRYNELKRKETGSGIEGDNGVILKPFEKTEMNDLESKIKKYIQLQQETQNINVKAQNEKRPLTSDEIKQVANLNKQRFTLTQNYLGGKDTSLVLANKFNLKLKEPNENGVQYLELDKKGNPMFSDEFRNTLNNKDLSPIDYWGSMLGDEIKLYKDNLSSTSKEWATDIKNMEKSEHPYAKGFARAFDSAMSEKFDIKDKNTGQTRYGWEGSWKLNSSLRNITRNWFNLTNEEGYSHSQPYRRIAAITAGKSSADISKAVGRADVQTRKISEQNRLDRLDKIAGGKAPVIPEGMRVKDENQIKNVSEDLTPFDMMTNGLLNAEARNQLINEYNSLRKEIGGVGLVKPELSSQMKLLFEQIKKLSANIPDEVKTWKLGSKIVLKNSGEPTFEEGLKDGLNVAASIFKMKKSANYVDFDKLKDSLKKKFDLLDPKGQGGPTKNDGQGGPISNIWGGIKNVLSNTRVYQAPEKQIPNLDTKKFLQGIGTNETSIVKGDKYSSHQPSGYSNLGSAMGKYRVTEGELSSYGPRYVGRKITKQEFLSSPELQDTYMINKAIYLNNLGYSPAEIADIHNKGMTNSYPPGSGKYQNPNYVKNFNSIYNATSSLSD